VSERAATRWRTLRDMVHGGLLRSGKRPRPTTTGKPLIKRRLVADEVASEIVAVRLTPTEKARAEELAQARGVTPGLLLRTFVQLAGEGVLVPTAPVLVASPPTIDELLAELVAGDQLEELRRVCEAALDGSQVVHRRRRQQDTGTEAVQLVDAVPACPLTWADVQALATAAKVRPDPAMTSPAKVWACARAALALIDDAHPLCVARTSLLCRLAPSESKVADEAVDLGLAYLVERGVVVREERPGWLLPWEVVNQLCGGVALTHVCHWMAREMGDTDATTPTRSVS